jgi:ComF family protein
MPGAGPVSRNLQRLLDPLTSLFFPPYCAVCNRRMELRRLLKNVCEECWNDVRQIGEVVCFRCGLPLESAATLEAAPAYFCSDCRGARLPYKLMRSLYHYQSPMREMVHLFKFEGMVNIGEELGKRLALWAVETSDLRAAEVVTPVPLHPLRRMGRGFNQSEILARHVARRMGLPMVKALTRLRNTRPQSLLQPEERRRNVKGAFASRKPASIKGKKVLLVDDVAATETTVRECARALRRGGAAQVLVLTLSRSATRY